MAIGGPLTRVRVQKQEEITLVKDLSEDQLTFRKVSGRLLMVVVSPPEHPLISGFSEAVLRVENALNQAETAEFTDSDLKAMPGL